MEPLDASKTAGTVMKRAAEELFKEYGYAFGTKRVIGKIPKILATL
jgi:NAD(P)H-hydrate repair Nnr-like enzyme with NAD(P)H-hydrate dehydratase domain